MLGSITPLGERSRGRRWGATVTAYAIGSILGGAAMGAIAGAIGVLALGRLSQPQALAILAVLAALGLAADLHVGGLRLPGPRRQVDERWLHRYRGWVYGIGFGFQLGFGLLTIVTTSTVYLTTAAAGLSASIPAAIAIGALFGAARASTLLAARSIRTPAGLVAIDGMLRRREPVARKAALAATVVVVVVSLAVAVS